MSPLTVMNCQWSSRSVSGHSLVAGFAAPIRRSTVQHLSVNMNKTSVTLNEILAQLRAMLPALSEKHHVQTLEAFGSYVRGEEREDSDLDLLVTFAEIPSLFQYVALENYLSDTLGVKVDLVMKDSLKPAIGKRILEEAQSI